MAEKYCLILLLTSGYPSQMLEEKLLTNSILKENFFFLRMKNPAHVLYEKILKTPILEEDLPILMLGDQVVIKGDEAVMDLMNKQVALGGLPEIEIQADFAQEMMSKILPAMRQMSELTPLIENQEFYDIATNLFEKMLILILGGFFMNIPQFEGFLSLNDLEFPKFPFEMENETKNNRASPEGVIDIEFDETFLSSFWQFSLSPPVIEGNKWLELFSDLSSLGIPIVALIKSLGWYMGSWASKDLKMLGQIRQILPPSWGEFLELDQVKNSYQGGIQLNTPITNHFGWDLMFLAFFIKGAIENAVGEKLGKFEVSYKANSKYFEFNGKIQDIIEI